MLIVVSMLFSTHITLLLCDPALSGRFWPGDILTWIVSGLGGTTQQTPSGGRAVQLSAITVCLRVAILLLVFSTGIWLGRRTTRRKQQEWEQFCSNVTSAMLLTMSWWLIALSGETLWPAAERLALTAAPLWTMTGCAAVVYAALLVPIQWLPQSGATTEAEGRRQWYVLLTWTFVWACVSYWMNHRLYQLLLIPHGDSAMYEEHLWNVWHGKGFRSYLDQGLFLGEHFQVIHLLLLPLHRLWPSHLLLELSETIALAVCTIPIFRIAVRHSGRRTAALLLAAAWLFYSPMHFLDIAVDQKTFRPICLALPFLFWMIDFAERRRIAGMILSLLIALSAKEDIALVTAPLLAVLAILQWKRGRSTTDDADSASSSRTLRWLIAGSLFSVIYLGLVVTIGISAFRDGDVVHYSRYFGELGSSPGELLRNSIARPQLLFAQLFSVRTFVYLLIFLAPLGFIPLRRPLLLLAGLPSFAMLSLLQFSDQQGGLPPVPYHHFHAPLLPVLFWAAAAGLPVKTAGAALVDSHAKSRHRWLTERVGRYLPAWNARPGLWILMCSILTGVVTSPMPWGAGFWSQESTVGFRNLYLPEDPRLLHRAEMAKVVQQIIPMDARVAATDFIHTRLTHRQRSYDYSKYPRAVNQNRPGAPPDTDYIVIDTQHRYSEITTVDQIPEYQRNPEGWKVLPDRTDGFFVILQRIDQPNR